MTIQGQVSTMPLADLFQWLGNANMTGGLRVNHARSTTRVAWTDGRITGCSSDDPPKLLGQFLLFHGAVTEDVLRRAMSEQETTGRSLPEILLEIEEVTAADLDRIVVAKSREAILGLFDTDDADFSFDESEIAGPNAVLLDILVQDVLLEGMKRIDDKARIGSIFKDPSMVVAHTGQEPSAEVFTEWPKRETYMAIDGERTIEEITLRVHGTEFRVSMILLQLFEDGLIEPRGLRPLSPPDDEAVTRTTQDTEIESEIAREELLDKIPVPTRPRHEITAAGISAEEDFLLSLSDGTWDVRALTWVAPMRPDDVLSGLERLQARGLVELRAASPASSR